VPEPAAGPAAALAAALDGVGPFETAPHLAVAVSGGADSLALVLLADAWARRRGGRVTALTVDHGLRAGAADEARAVGRRLAARGIDHHVLVWAGPRPRSGVQARARAARYRLLEGWCEAQGVLHLLTGHTAEDQAETLLLRLRRDSTLHGLAGIGAVMERPWGRVLRPLLGCRHAALCAWLAAQGLGWIEDPSNHDARFERSRLRAEIAARPGAAAALHRLATRLGRLRAADERLLNRLLARHVRLQAGRALIAAGAAALPGPFAVALLARACQAVGGAERPPPAAALRQALDRLAQGTATTLGGCRLGPGPKGLVIRPEGVRRHGVSRRPQGPPAALGPAPFRLVSPAAGPTYALSHSDSDPGACMLSAPLPAGPAGRRGTQWKGAGS